MKKEKENKKEIKKVNPLLAWGLILLTVGTAILVFLIKYLPAFKDFIAN